MEVFGVKLDDIFKSVTCDTDLIFSEPNLDKLNGFLSYFDIFALLLFFVRSFSSNYFLPFWISGCLRLTGGEIDY